MYTKNDWMNALHAAESADWDEVDIREGENLLALAVLEAYESDKVDKDPAVLEAAICAAWNRYHGTWDSDQFESVWTNYVQAMDDWQAVAEDYFDTEYPGLVTAFGKHMDLEQIGREYARDREREQYITIPDDSHVYIFNKI